MDIFLYSIVTLRSQKYDDCDNDLQKISGKIDANLCKICSFADLWRVRKAA